MVTLGNRELTKSKHYYACIYFLPDSCTKLFHGGLR